MRFEFTDEQRDFASALDQLLRSADTVTVARAWAEGDTEQGRKLWARLAEQGLTVLATDASPVEVCVAFEALGRHAVPGPWVESAAYLPVLLGHEIDEIATVAVPPHAPFALDADVAGTVLVIDGNTVTPGEAGELRRSVDPTRRLFEVSSSHSSGPAQANPVDPGAQAAAFEMAVLATSAQLLGLGDHLLSATVDYAKQRRQFGREIGSYQAIKHRLADVRIALDFARPLVFGAALDEVPASAAKVATADAAYLAARTALQVHGAVGYTTELDLSLWILKVRALVTAWGTPAYHRARVLEAIV